MFKNLLLAFFFFFLVDYNTSQTVHFNSADKNQWFAKEYLKSKKRITRGEKAIYKLEFFSVKTNVLIFSSM